jgi:hypothetical protein
MCADDIVCSSLGLNAGGGWRLNYNNPAVQRAQLI